MTGILQRSIGSIRHRAARNEPDHDCEIAIWTPLIQAVFERDVLAPVGGTYFGEPLLQPVLRHGELVAPLPLAACREHAAQELLSLPPQLALTGIGAVEIAAVALVFTILDVVVAPLRHRRLASADTRRPAARVGV
jgi:hypothetical protein